MESIKYDSPRPITLSGHIEAFALEETTHLIRVVSQTQNVEFWILRSRLNVPDKAAIAANRRARRAAGSVGKRGWPKGKPSHNAGSITPQATRDKIAAGNRASWAKRKAVGEGKSTLETKALISERVVGETKGER